MGLVRKECHIFTMDLMVSLGADDSEETRTMVFKFNDKIRFWNIENKKYMEHFINLVKARTDALSSEIDAPSTEMNPVSSKCEAEKMELAAKLKESESKRAKAEVDARSLQAKLNQLKGRPPAPHATMLKNFTKSYMAKCNELISLRGEFGRYTIWYRDDKIRAEKVLTEKSFAEMQLQITALKKHYIERADHDIKEMQKKNTADNAQVLKLQMHRCTGFNDVCKTSDLYAPGPGRAAREKNGTTPKNLTGECGCWNRPRFSSNKSRDRDFRARTARKDSAQSPHTMENWFS
jgi:hypothetical protein